MPGTRKWIVRYTPFYGNDDPMSYGPYDNPDDAWKVADYLQERQDGGWYAEPLPPASALDDLLPPELRRGR